MSAVNTFAVLLDQGVMNSRLRHFCERFKPRVVEMALFESDQDTQAIVITRLIPQFHR